MIHRLLYVSRVAPNVRYDDAQSIADVSRRNNSVHELTGFLLYSPRYFLQALEGDLDRVLRTYAKIEKDPRHSDLTQYAPPERVEERLFAEWSMGIGMLQYEESPEHWSAAQALDVLLEAAAPE